MSITKGRWRWADDRQGNRWGRKELMPCVISGTVEGLIDVSDEDAALIESAPELFDEVVSADTKLHSIEDDILCGRIDEALQKCRMGADRRKEIIGKAKGES